MTEPLLHLQDITRVYGKGDAEVRALNGVDLTIQEGEFVAIVGQSGSGKSTLMNLLGCLDRPTSGTYRIHGQDVSRMDADALAALRRRTFGFVFQRYNLLANVSASENVEIPAVYAGVGQSERKARAQELLQRLGLGGREKSRPGQLSGGQQQRVAVARALMNDAEVILADEPTGALDTGTSEELLELLEELHRSGRTVILITHDQDVAERADRTIEIRDGKIISDSGYVDRPLETLEHREVKSSPSFFLQLTESIKTAFRSLRANLFRTALTLLGVVIGVAAVVAMLAVGQGSQREVMARFEDMGANLLFVFPGGDRGARMRGDAIATLTLEDAEALAELDNVLAAVPSRSGTATLRRGSEDHRGSVEGVSEDWLLANNRQLAYGSFFTAEDVDRRVGVVVLGTTTAGELFDNVSDAVGEYVFLSGAPFEVAGVLEEEGASSFGRDQDDLALIPITTGMMRVFGSTYLSNVTIAVEDTDIISDTEEAANSLLLERHGTDDFRIRNTASILESVQETQNSFSMLLGAVASISLLVGGIGVMNIMLVSVSERTREIGVRMATGARRSDILVQFIVEAVVVCALGGVIGILTGFAVCAILANLGTSIAITPMPAILAFSTAFLTGFVFGFLPARNASRLDPVRALAAE